MNWTHHYTGHDYAELRHGRLSLYLNRDSKSKRLTFVRLSLRHRMIGIFLGRTNYVQGFGGFELFTSKMHVGWARRSFRSPLIRWSGSGVRPYSAATLHVGGFGIGAEMPRWAQNWKSKREDKRFAAQNLPFILLLAVMLSGCMQATANWTKPGASASDIERAQLECKFEAEKAAPEDGFKIARYKQINEMCLQLKGYSRAS